VSDIYQNWRDRLAGKDVPIHADHPDPGYYKVRDGRDGPWRPCAIWPNNGELVCRVGSDTRDPLVTWSFAAKSPIAKDVAKFAFENGYFPDEPKPVALSNMPSDPFEALMVEIEDKSAQAEELLTGDVTSQQGCDLARNMQAQLLALNKRADAMHKAEKAPVLLQQREIDERFRFRDKVADIASRLRFKFEGFLRAEERRQREEADRKHREETARIEAERKRIEAERAKLKEDEPVAFHTSPEPELPELPTAPEPVKVSAGGGFGRRAGLKSVWAATLSDIDAALAHYKDNAKVRELIQKLADADVRAGKRNVPGFAISEERRAA
jgi:hypothetical protein